MFTGIIETLGTIEDITNSGNNLAFTISSPIADELKIDQSIAHNGICLTVVSIEGVTHTVTAIRETIEKTNIGDWKAGDTINLERGMKLNDRLDGHIVQGHVDQIGICKNIENANGSWYYTFEYNPDSGNITIEKGSITVNGVSLTVVNSGANQFSVAIIPYTYENTTIRNLTIGSKVNLEFDVIGKYVSKLYNVR